MDEKITKIFKVIILTAISLSLLSILSLAMTYGHEDGSGKEGMSLFSAIRALLSYLFYGGIFGPILFLLGLFFLFTHFKEKPEPKVKDNIQETPKFK